uniref:Uncharacterized protein n=1 Tax=Salarias fasciatus TaxID=181472 RepID=A0A672FIX2_SALFA
CSEKPLSVGLLLTDQSRSTPPPYSRTPSPVSDGRQLMGVEPFQKKHNQAPPLSAHRNWSCLQLDQSDAMDSALISSGCYSPRDSAPLHWPQPGDPRAPPPQGVFRAPPSPGDPRAPPPQGDFRAPPSPGDPRAPPPQGDFRAPPSPGDPRAPPPPVDCWAANV